MIRGLSGTAIAESESEMDREDDGQLQGEVKDLEHGVKQGGKVIKNERVASPGLASSWAQVHFWCYCCTLKAFC